MCMSFFVSYHLLAHGYSLLIVCWLPGVNCLSVCWCGRANIDITN
jgi:hypothetical protein